MAHLKPVPQLDESVADLVIATALLFTLLSCLILVGIF